MWCSSSTRSTHMYGELEMFVKLCEAGILLHKSLFVTLISAFSRNVSLEFLQQLSQITIRNLFWLSILPADAILCCPVSFFCSITLLMHFIIISVRYFGSAVPSYITAALCTIHCNHVPLHTLYHSCNSVPLGVIIAGKEKLPSNDSDLYGQ